MRVVNLTPHPIVLKSRTLGVDDMTIQPSGLVARVNTISGEELKLMGDGLPVALFTSPTYGEVEGLPDPIDDVIFIVSSIVAARCTGRSDVFSPGTGPQDEAVRDEKGRIIGVTRLIQAPSL